MELDKQEAIRRLIDIFAREWPRKNHIIVIDMLTGAYRVDQMLVLEKPGALQYENKPVRSRNCFLKTQLDQG